MRVKPAVRALAAALAAISILPATAAAAQTARIVVEREPGLTAHDRADVRRVFDSVDALRVDEDAREAVGRSTGPI